MDASPLNKIPAELRNYIFSFVLQPEDDTIVTSADSPSGLNITTKPLLLTEDPGITQTCRQLRSETLLVYYAQHFLLEATEWNIPRLAEHLESKPPSLWANITHLTVLIPGKEFNAWEDWYEWSALIMALREAGFNDDRLTYTSALSFPVNDEQMYQEELLRVLVACKSRHVENLLYRRLKLNAYLDEADDETRRRWEKNLSEEFE